MSQLEGENWSVNLIEQPHFKVEGSNPCLDSFACKIDHLQPSTKPRGQSDEVRWLGLVKIKTSSLQLYRKPTFLPVFERVATCGSCHTPNERARLTDDNEQTFRLRPLFCLRRTCLLSCREAHRGNGEHQPFLFTTLQNRQEESRRLKPNGP